MKPSSKQPDTISLIQRLLRKKMMFPNWRMEQQLKTAEGRRLNKFVPEPEIKKEKQNG